MDISQIMNQSLLNKSILCPFEEEKHEEVKHDITEVPSISSSDVEEVIKTKSSKSDNA